jgi:peptidylprolyl isomerase
VQPKNLLLLALVSASAVAPALGCAKKDSATKDSASVDAAVASAFPPKKPGPPPIPAPDDVAAADPDAVKTASGLATKVLTPGTGTVHPTTNDRVKVNYTGWTTDGKMFDSSVTRGQPATFGVKDVIPGWTEGLQLMVAGEKRRMWIPAEIAYGARAMPGIPANSALTFDVELLDITAMPKPPPVPDDVAAAPASAKKTASGLAYKMLQAGTDPKAAKPDPTSMVTVNYTGWTTDGKMFDSSITRGQPAKFPLGRVIKGWTEGLQLMKVGDKMRFWIPGKLAYEDPDRPKRPGAPQGMLVFDVELIDVAAGPPQMPGMAGMNGMGGMHPHPMPPGAPGGGPAAGGGATPPTPHGQ